MKEITIIIPCWGRYEIFNIIASNIARVQKAITKYKINVMVGLSLEDLEKQMLLDTTRNYNFAFCTFPNDQLGAKHNYIIKCAFESFPNTDYIMNLGSDDLIHESLFELYESYIQAETKYFGVDTVYFWNKITNEAIRYKYQDRVFVIGAGRMLHKSIFQVSMKIYNDNINSALDGNSAANIIRLGFERTRIEVDDFPYLVDIKADFNINSYQKIIEKSPGNCTVVDSENILKVYGLEQKHKITVDSCNVEFGYELIAAVPYAYYLYKQGKLKETISAKGSEALYYFSPKHTINKQARKYENIKKVAREG